MVCKTILIAVTFLLFPTVFAVLASGQKTGGRCSINAWIEDAELPKIDSSIRSGPSKKSRSLLEVPFAGDGDEPVAVEIIGSSGGYLKIRKASTSNGSVTFSGVGWVLARRVSVFVDSTNGRSSKLYAAPNATSRKVSEVNHGTLLNFSIVGFSCFGLRVQHEDRTGWLAKDEICGNGVECHKKFDYKVN